ncbi:MAG TPA: hypothetical protein VLF79_03685 [Candidatus Saccharimonadales bacterium]|nr:hypothetical protein [Candidatus Saccharimonadales bacterium]
MLAIEVITQDKEEQQLIALLDGLIQPLYRDLPYHNYGHARDEVLPVALKLDDLDPAGGDPVQRRELIVESLGHDALDYLPLTDENFKSKEERAAYHIAWLLRRQVHEDDIYFNEFSIEQIGKTIERNKPGEKCVTPNDFKLRRADLSNVGSPFRTVFLAGTVKLFHERVILDAEAGQLTPPWPEFLDEQVSILHGLLQQDLSIGGERKVRRSSGQISKFGQLANSNVSLLSSKLGVRDPERFIRRYGTHLLELVPDFKNIVPLIRGQADGGSVS